MQCAPQVIEHCAVIMYYTNSGSAYKMWCAPFQTALTTHILAFIQAAEAIVVPSTSTIYKPLTATTGSIVAI